MSNDDCEIYVTIQSGVADLRSEHIYESGVQLPACHYRLRRNSGRDILSWNPLPDAETEYRKAGHDNTGKIYQPPTHTETHRQMC